MKLEKYGGVRAPYLILLLCFTQTFCLQKNENRRNQINLKGKKKWEVCQALRLLSQPSSPRVLVFF